MAPHPGSANHEATSSWAQGLRDSKMTQADLAQSFPGTSQCDLTEQMVPHPLSHGLEPANSWTQRTPRNRSRNIQREEKQEKVRKSVMTFEYQHPELPKTPKFILELPVT